MIKVLIVDDEPLAREIIRNFASGVPSLQVVGECSNGFEALKAIQQESPDLLFLDIQMPKLDGFELLEVLDSRPEIIFTTAYDQYAIKAFEQNVVDYLLKPFSRERFLTAVQKAEKRIQNGDGKQGKYDNLQEHLDSAKMPLDRVVTRLGSKITVVPVENIWYVEAQDDYVMIYSEMGNHLKERTMKYFEQHLPPGTFVRVHRSYIVNLSQITAVEPYSKDTKLVILRCGAKLKVSEEGYRNLRRFL
jgi:two-component system, LytTR family, response regulator